MGVVGGWRWCVCVCVVSSLQAGGLCSCVHMEAAGAGHGPGGRQGPDAAAGWGGQEQWRAAGRPSLLPHPPPAPTPAALGHCPPPCACPGPQRERFHGVFQYLFIETICTDLEVLEVRRPLAGCWELPQRL